MPPKSLPPDLDRQLQGELDASETLLWSGQPSPSRMACLVRAEYLKGLGTSLGGLLWSCAILLAWLLPHDGSGPHKPYNPASAVLNIMFGLALIASGPLAIAVGSVMLKAPRRQRESAANTVYVLTDGRILIIQGHGRSGKVTAQSLPQYVLGNRIMTEEEDGSGDLTFPDAGTFMLESSFSEFFQDAQNDIGIVENIPISFYGILDVKGVDELIQHTLDNQRNKPGEMGTSPV